MVPLMGMRKLPPGYVIYQPGLSDVSLKVPEYVNGDTVTIAVSPASFTMSHF
jgi:hypothetical protein